MGPQDIPNADNVFSVHFCLPGFCTEAALRGLLGALTSTPYSPTQHLEREQALAKQFAEILHFTLRFDELKVSLQNEIYKPCSSRTLHAR